MAGRAEKWRQGECWAGVCARVMVGGEGGPDPTTRTQAAHNRHALSVSVRDLRAHTHTTFQPASQCANRH
jgi:hypothetical protein